jgi:hypothetical protein
MSAVASSPHSPATGITMRDPTLEQKAHAAGTLPRAREATRRTGRSAVGNTRFDPRGYAPGTKNHSTDK